MKKSYLFIIGIIIFVVILFFAFNNYIYNQKQASPENIVPYQATLTGEYVCLPHKDTSGPQTLECAFGLKTESNEYYALDFNQLPDEMQNLSTGNKYKFSGTITPVEMLSSNHWQIYPIEGILSVTEIQKL